MDPFHWDELPLPKPDLKELLLYGSLPLVITNPDEAFKETDLFAYTIIYLERD